MKTDMTGDKLFVFRKGKRSMAKLKNNFRNDLILNSNMMGEEMVVSLFNILCFIEDNLIKNHG